MENLLFFSSIRVISVQLLSSTKKKNKFLYLTRIIQFILLNSLHLKSKNYYEIKNLQKF